MEILIIKNNHIILDWESKSPITKYKNMETLSTKIVKDKRLNKFVVTLLGLSLYCKSVFAASNLTGVDKLGWVLLSLVRKWGYHILVIMCIVEVIRAGIGGDSKKILGIIMKFLLMFASLYLVPSLFDAIRTSF